MIAIANDHGGYPLKAELLKHLEEKGLKFKDFGCYDETSCDYPDFAKIAAEAVASGECEKGIFFCGTGIGISIAANKVPGIRAALCHDVFSAKATRRHNDANVLCFGARVIGPGLMLEIVDAFLAGEFEGGRHQTRLDKIAAIEKKYGK